MDHIKDKNVLSLDIIGIQKRLRNRYPLLFIDKVTEAVPGKYAKAVKNFTYNEWFFPVHFKDEPNVPGFLQLEILIQTFLMTFLTIEELKGKKTADVSINNVRFKRKIVPGDVLEIRAELDSFRHGIAKGHVESFVSGEAAASAEIVVAVPSLIVKVLPDAREPRRGILSFPEVFADLGPENTLAFDVMGIQKCQVNRHPMLFIDKAALVVPGKCARAVKNFTYNEWFFPPHFDDEPNVPGCIQIEALVQTFMMTFLSLDEFKGSKAVNNSIQHVKLKRRLVPGDALEIWAVLDSFRRGIAKGRVESFVSGEAAASAEFVTVIPDIMGGFHPRDQKGQ